MTVLTCTNRLRLVRTRDDEEPTLTRPGWPECGPERFKLQQLWTDQSGEEIWHDIDIEEDER